VAFVVLSCLTFDEVNSPPAELIYNAINKLTPSERASFLNLSYVHVPAGAPLDQVALGIFQTNGIAAGEGRVGLFPRTARLNHGCSKAFNVVYSWREEPDVLVVYALKRIKAGEVCSYGIFCSQILIDV
jgi:hypothetical protein